MGKVCIVVVYSIFFYSFPSSCEGVRPLGPKEIDGLLVSPGKASLLLTDHLITGYPLRSELAQEKWFQVKPISLFGLVGWIFQALVGCHDILILGKSPIKWRLRPDMTLAVDWDVKHLFKQTNYLLVPISFRLDASPIE